MCGDEVVVDTILTCCVLHNIYLTHDDDLSYFMDDDGNDDGALQGDGNDGGGNGGGVDGNAARSVRNNAVQALMAV